MLQSGLQDLQLTRVAVSVFTYKFLISIGTLFQILVRNIIGKGLNICFLIIPIQNFVSFQVLQIEKLFHKKTKEVFLLYIYTKK